MFMTWLKRKDCPLNQLSLTHTHSYSSTLKLTAASTEGYSVCVCEHWSDAYRDQVVCLCCCGWPCLVIHKSLYLLTWSLSSIKPSWRAQSIGSHAFSLYCWQPTSHMYYFDIIEMKNDPVQINYRSLIFLITPCSHGECETCVSRVQRLGKRRLAYF